MSLNKKLQMIFASCMMSASILQNSTGMKEDISLEAQTIEANYRKRVERFSTPLMECLKHESYMISPDFPGKYSCSFEKVRVITLESILKGCCESAEEITRYLSLLDNPAALMNEFQTVVGDLPFSIVFDNNDLQKDLVTNLSTKENKFFAELCECIAKSCNSKKQREMLIAFLAALNYRKSQGDIRVSVAKWTTPNDNERGTAIHLDDTQEIPDLYLILFDRNGRIFSEITARQKSTEERMHLRGDECYLHELGHATARLLNINLPEEMGIAAKVMDGTLNPFLADLAFPPLNWSDESNRRNISFCLEIIFGAIKACISSNHSSLHESEQFARYIQNISKEDLAEVLLKKMSSTPEKSAEKNSIALQIAQVLKDCFKTLSFWNNNWELMQIIGINDIGDGYLLINRLSDLDYFLEKDPEKIRWFHTDLSGVVPSSYYPSNELFGILKHLHGLYNR